jgi:hypothetical protein
LAHESTAIALTLRVTALENLREVAVKVEIEVDQR